MIRETRFHFQTQDNLVLPWEARESSIIAIANELSKMGGGFMLLSEDQAYIPKYRDLKGPRMRDTVVELRVPLEDSRVVWDHLGMYLWPHGGITHYPEEHRAAGHVIGETLPVNLELISDELVNDSLGFFIRPRVADPWSKVVELLEPCAPHERPPDSVYLEILQLFECFARPDDDGTSFSIQSTQDVDTKWLENLCLQNNLGPELPIDWYGA